MIVMGPLLAETLNAVTNQERMQQDSQRTVRQIAVRRRQWLSAEMESARWAKLPSVAVEIVHRVAKRVTAETESVVTLDMAELKRETVVGIVVRALLATGTALAIPFAEKTLIAEIVIRAQELYVPA